MHDQSPALYYTYYELNYMYITILEYLLSSDIARSYDTKCLNAYEVW